MLSRREKKWLFCRHLIRYWCLMDFVSHWLFKQTSKSPALKPYFMWCTCLLKHKHVGKDNFQGEILVSTLPSCGSKVISMKHLKGIATPFWMGCWSIAGLPLNSMSPVPIYTPGWRETKWGKVPCLRKQLMGEAWTPHLKIQSSRC